jgi:hypothetical protein
MGDVAVMISYLMRQQACLTPLPLPPHALGVNEMQHVITTYFILASLVKNSDGDWMKSYDETIER